MVTRRKRRVLGAVASAGRMRPAPMARRPDAARAMRLFGRTRELAALRATLEVSIDGIKSVVVLRGEAGAGKSAILDTFAERAPSNVLVLRIEGVESEADIGYGGLQRLLNASVAQVRLASRSSAGGAPHGVRSDRRPEA